MTKLDGKTPDLAAENIEQLRQIFPDVFEEGKIDFDKLKQVLGEYVDDAKERYNFTWNGKGKALRLAQTPTTGTLRPCEAESKNWDDTQNLYIEGDNLEVLKLLQKSYHGKIKMIYIDPPYNTGGDFVYPDDFSDSIENYKRITGQVDDEGNRLGTNTEANGRYHTDWLNIMMYPRLKLARNLLSEEGVIFISIDDHEVDNLKKICNEALFESNFIAQLIWQNKKGGGNDSTYIAIEHEYILVYAKNKSALGDFYERYSADYIKRYKEKDEIGRFYWDTFKRKSGKQYYPIECPDGTILQYDEDGNPISWLRSEERFKSDLKCGDVRFVNNSGKWSVQFKQRMPLGKTPRSIFTTETVIDDKGTTSTGSSDVYTYFKKDVFSNPKPVDLIKFLIGFGASDRDIILDFFSGSGTMAEAVLQCNAEDGAERKFIAVQLQENIDKMLNSSDANAKRIAENAVTVLDELGLPHIITELAKLRIRRAGEKIKAEIEEQNAQLKLGEEPKKVPDIGFKVFKLDSSNLKQWQPDYDDLEATLFDSISNYVEGRSELDVVYEIMLKMGMELTWPLETHTIASKNVYEIGMGALMICLDDHITTEVAEGMVALYKELAPETWRVVFKDNGFADDSAKVNIKEILKTAGLEEDAFTTV